MLIGYARVSTVAQSLALQIEALKNAGCEKIYEDQISGSNMTRTALQTAMEVLRPGDTLVVWKLDHVMASLAQMERELVVERTKAGLEAAKRLGRKGGRKRVMTDGKLEAAKKLLQNGISAKEVAKNLGVSIPTLYRWLPAGCDH